MFWVCCLSEQIVGRSNGLCCGTAEPIKEWQHEEEWEWQGCCSEPTGTKQLLSTGLRLVLVCIGIWTVTSSTRPPVQLFQRCWPTKGIWVLFVRSLSVSVLTLAHLQRGVAWGAAGQGRAGVIVRKNWDTGPSSSSSPPWEGPDTRDRISWECNRTGMQMFCLHSLCSSQYLPFPATYIQVNVRLCFLWSLSEPTHHGLFVLH